MQIHVINLERNPDRLAQFTAVNGHLTTVVRFPAVDGQRLDLESLVRQGLASEDVLNTYSLSAIGLALSHLSLWDSAIATGKMVTIAEDDAIFNFKFETYASEVIEALPVQWDLIVWGWNFERVLCFELLPGVSTCLAQFEQDRLRLGTHAFQSQSLSPRPFRLVWAFGTPCYTISGKGAQTLRSKCLPLRPRLLSFPLGARVPPYATHYRTVGLDVLMNLAYGQLEAFVCVPPLVLAKNETEKSMARPEDGP